MDSTIMDYNLNLKAIFWRVEHIYHDQEIISRTHDSIVRYTYKDFSERVRKLANFLRTKNLAGENVATIAWNTQRHLELYFAVPLLGGVLHTVNVRFHPSEMEYVIREMEDKAVFIDRDISYKGDNVTVLDERYDDEINSFEPLTDLPDIDEKVGAVACFTSGTTGKPKGVIYSHRSIFIHSLSLLAKDVVGISSRDTVMPLVPMFHISAWDLPFASLMTGAKLVLPGPRPKAEDIVYLIKRYNVSIGAGAPTVWIDVLNYVEREKMDLSPLKVVVTGGAEPPQGLMKKLKELGVRTYHAWGMTETEAIATVNQSDSVEELSKQGYPMPGFEIGLMDENNRNLPWDGKSVGELVARGAFVTKKYYKQSDMMVNGFIRTGDVAKIYPDGNVKVVDRLKDLIKSGGEWISSVDLENAIMSYEKVLEAVVVGIKDEKWGERPIALVVKKPDKDVNAEEIITYLKSLGRFPNWWMPEKIIFVDSIPKTSTGKLDKKVIRDMLKTKYENKL
ncbi:long-chain fatty acid--CoA ligase [Sulfolobus acidocaldarius]|uniref:Acyl-CoA synthetase n=4 Tax=Sulfolobus acidocaldarius TaxID=2285 RepID=Q4J9U1_SULAC|nr:long-chain fatty acid--CoA ligase [Sulfolobus acidocaldarius]AAY80439.1 acyl-CoA synthetase [Sulfolobus acidocaldarius DSM 639]AGE71023.1 acyl-CoA synthetase [Sulfolobus acidocaldarius N8]AGE73294.1 acyl-CoA synthetase [Sulfolobus acidocaldarius Ron12/I]ALU28684.1 AMP-dependent synthetase [Sulfolobus acidocaldarius]ALU31401.1 AMP-dependent synthetase [Sulfolobus acidocaldarius]